MSESKCDHSACLVPFTIQGAPRTKKNHGRRVKYGGRTYSIQSKAHERWHAEAVSRAWKIKQDIREMGVALPIRGRVAVYAEFYQDRKRGADECGYMQALGDWLQDVQIIENDRQVHWAGVELMVDEQRPRIYVMLRFQR